jgi:gliding motility-associated-like protein
MRNFSILAIFFIFPIGSYSQLTTSTAITPAQMVQNVLLGNGVTATNITFSGVTNARGTFTCSVACNLGISNGIVLSTGNIDGTGTAAIGGNASNFLGTDLGLPGDPVLEAIVNGLTYDAVSLEFDFSVASDSVSFRYVFASEEYNEYVNSSYNDIFGFFISGPCIPSGGSNIALIPGTSTPVSINNVNNGYASSASSGPCTNCNYYVDNYNGGSVAFDGFTTVLTASAKVVPCATYHIKIIIADVGDGDYDSAVFLEANSFSSIGTVPILVDNLSTFSDSALTICPTQNVQICAATPCATGASVLMWNNGSSSVCQTLSAPGTYSYTFTNTVNVCTATSPVITVTQPPGTTVDIPQDTIIGCAGSPVQISATGTGSLTWNTGATTSAITVNNPGWYSVSVTGACGVVSDSVFVDFNNVLPSISGGTGICQGDTIILTANPAGMQYQWSNNQISQSIIVSSPGTYNVTVTTTGGCSASASVIIPTFIPPVPAISGNISICNGNVTVLDAGNGYVNYLWSDYSTSQSINVNTSGNYFVTVTDANGCTGTANVAVMVNNNPAPVISGNLSICDGDATTLDAGNGNVNYLWSDNSTSQSINVNTTGNYFVTVTDANGCIGTANVAVVVNNNPAPVISGNLSICDGDATTLDAGNGYVNYLWSDNSTSQNINVNSAGNYSVTVTDVNGCTGFANTTVTVNSLPVPVISGSTSFCPAGFTVLDAGAGYSSYLWTTGSTSQSITTNTTGTCSVTVTDNNGCQGNASVNLTLQPNLTPVITGINSICPGETTTLDAGAGYAIYQWSTGASAQTISANSAGLYIVTVTDVSGCSGTTSINVNIFPISVPAITGNTTICNGDATTLDAGNGYVNYLWSDNSTSQNINVNSAGNYFVTVTDANGCTGTANAAVVVNNNPAPVISGNLSICDGDATTLDAGNGYVNYLWSDNSPSQNINVNSAGNYSVTVTDVNGCTGFANTTVTVNSLPVPVISGSTSFCPAGFTVLDAGAGYSSYLWTTGSTSQSITTNTTGTCSVTVTDNNGCQGNASVNLTLQPNLTPVITGINSICPDETTTLDAGAGYATYQWSTGASAQTISANSAGLYIVTVTDVSGCSGTANLNITIYNPVQVAITGSNSFCIGGSTLLNAGTGFDEYLWSTGDTTQFITVTSSGGISVTVTDNNGCPTSANTFIYELPYLTPQISGNTNFCQGTTTILDAGFGYFSYLWSNGSNSPTINVSASGTYSVTVTDATGCTGSDSIIINVFNNPTPVINGITGFCFGNSTILDAGSGFVTYLWSTNENISQLNVTDPGNYTVTVTDINGCTGTASVQIVVNPLPNPVIAGDTLICTGDFTILDAGSGYDNYLWSSTETFQTINVNSSGIYLVTVTDSNGCSATAGHTVYVNIPFAEIIASGSTNFCDGDDVTLTANPGINYLWSTGEGTQSITVNTAGIYVVTVMDVAGCDTVADAVEVIVFSNPVIAITAEPSTGCAPLHVYFNNTTSGAFSYSWNFGDGNESNLMNPEHIFVQPGLYSITLRAISSEGCESVLTITDMIHAADKPIADFNYSPDELLMFASTTMFTDNSNDVVSWHWSFGDGKYSNLRDPVHYYSEPGEFIVKLMVENQFGCRDQKEKPLLVTPFYLPNSFTPNDDGRNDKFFNFDFRIDIKAFNLLIFDRWGNTIFESKDPLHTWDGYNSRREIVPEDVYVYVYEITTPDNKIHKFKGKVYLIR